MANFVESATLLVKDASTPQIRKINAALRQLNATARSLKSQKITLSVSERGLSKAAADARALTAALRQLQGAARGIRLNVNTGGLAAATRSIQQLRTAAQRPSQVATRAAAGGGARPPGGGLLGGGGPRGIGPFGVHVLSFPGGFANALANAIGRATKEGVRDVDIGDTALNALQLDRIAKAAKPGEGTATLKQATDAIAAQPHPNRMAAASPSGNSTRKSHHRT